MQEAPADILKLNTILTRSGYHCLFNFTAIYLTTFNKIAIKATQSAMWFGFETAALAKRQEAEMEVVEE